MSKGRVWIVAGLLGGMAAAAQAELNDPTRPPDYSTAPRQQGAAPAAAPENGWDLTSTLVSPARRLAVINGRVVTAGSRLGHMTVREIGSGRVVLEGEGRRQVLTLLGGAVKTPIHRRRGSAPAHKAP